MQPCGAVRSAPFLDLRERDTRSRPVIPYQYYTRLVGSLRTGVWEVSDELERCRPSSSSKNHASACHQQRGFISTDYYP